MIIMKPVFTVHALHHKVKLDRLVVLIASQIAVTINIEEGLVILVFGVFVVFICLKLAAEWLMGISTVTTKRSLAIELVDFMAFMTHQHAGETKTVRLNFLLKFLLTQILLI